jgi:FixJ family two-component response regulator
LTTRTFISTHEFLTQPEANAPACVVAKLLMAESGLELQRELATRESDVPVAFITAGTDVAAAARAMKAGAVSCLQVPVHGPELVAAVRKVRVRTSIELVRLLAAGGMSYTTLPQARNGALFDDSGRRTRAGAVR